MSSQSNDLHKLRIMVTRPKPQGEELCERIRDCGGEAIYFPTIDIEPISVKPFTLSHYDWIIFISSKAVYHLPFQSIPSQLKVAAVGLSTARALERKKISVTLYPEEEWSSEGLLQLPEFQNIVGKNILIVRGEGGREVLAKTLASRGAKVMHAIVYRRILPQIDIKSYAHLLQDHKIDIIVCTSSEGIQNLLQLFGEENVSYLRRVPILVVSERLRENAKELGFKQVIVANNANHETILETLAKEKRKLYD